MADEVLTLNIGGVIYTTTRSTLTKYPDSMLASMFGDRFLPTLVDAHGNHFIDRDGRMFKHVLNFLRSGIMCLPEDFNEYDLLEVEADFYQIPSLICAIRELRMSQDSKSGYFVEMLDFEESAYFYRFYSDPPRGIHTELKNGGLVLSGATEILKTFPLPDKSLADLQTGDSAYKTINISSSSCTKMSILHHLNSHGWKMLSSSFANNTDSDGSYMVHKYMWYLER